jgi:hypothetical protein
VAAERRSRSWWAKTVARWKASGLSASEFSAREDVVERTLRWWSSTLRRDTRAKRGSPRIEPIAIELVPSAPTFASPGGAIEIAIGCAHLRVEVGTDVAYVAALVRELGEER